ncbi:MAG: hypothetical protein KDD36_07800 [Flavobacteriales bacterium]|nr:hypothetical protein [Flavobacteriales bacterium]
MKRTYLTVCISGLFLSGMLFLAACGGGSENQGDAQNSEEPTETHMDGEAGHHHDGEGHDHDNANYDDAAGVYICPHKCEGNKTYAEAGTCPACGMQLELASGEATPAEGDATPAGGAEAAPSDAGAEG